MAPDLFEGAIKPRGLTNAGSCSSFNAAVQLLLSCQPLESCMFALSPASHCGSSSPAAGGEEVSTSCTLSSLSGKGPLGFALRQAFLHTSGHGHAVRPSGSYNPHSLFAALCRHAPSLKDSPRDDSYEALHALLLGIQAEDKSALELERKLRLCRTSSGSVSGGGPPTAGRLSCSVPSTGVTRQAATEGSASPVPTNQEQTRGVKTAVWQEALAEMPRTLVDHVFGGELQSSCSCACCGHEAGLHEPILAISLPLVPGSTAASLQHPPAATHYDHVPDDLSARCAEQPASGTLPASPMAALNSCHTHSCTSLSSPASLPVPDAAIGTQKGGLSVLFQHLATSNADASAQQQGSATVKHSGLAPGTIRQPARCSPFDNVVGVEAQPLHAICSSASSQPRSGISLLSCLDSFFFGATACARPAATTAQHSRSSCCGSDISSEAWQQPADEGTSGARHCHGTPQLLCSSVLDACSAHTPRAGRHQLRKQVSWSDATPTVHCVPGSAEQRGTDLEQARVGAAAFCRPVGVGHTTWLVTAQVDPVDHDRLLMRLAPRRPAGVHGRIAMEAPRVEQPSESTSAPSSRAGRAMPLVGATHAWAAPCPSSSLPITTPSRLAARLALSGRDWNVAHACVLTTVDIAVLRRSSDVLSAHSDLLPPAAQLAMDSVAHLLQSCGEVALRSMAARGLQLVVENGHFGVRGVVSAPFALTLPHDLTVCPGIPGMGRWVDDSGTDPHADAQACESAWTYLVPEDKHDALEPLGAAFGNATSPASALSPLAAQQQAHNAAGLRGLHVRVIPPATSMCLEQEFGGTTPPSSSCHDAQTDSPRHTDAVRNRRGSECGGVFVLDDCPAQASSPTPSPHAQSHLPAATASSCSVKSAQVHPFVAVPLSDVVRFSKTGSAPNSSHAQHPADTVSPPLHLLSRSLRPVMARSNLLRTPVRSVMREGVDSLSTSVKLCAQRRTLSQLPRALIVHLQRFPNDSSGRSMKKLVVKVDFTFQLDMSPYCSPGATRQGSTSQAQASTSAKAAVSGSASGARALYELGAVIEHVDDGPSGCFVRRPCLPFPRSDGSTGSGWQWFKITDHEVKAVSFTDVLMARAYVLLYLQI